jgi:hypothetical protein
MPRAIEIDGASQTVYTEGEVQQLVAAAKDDAAAASRKKAEKQRDDLQAELDRLRAGDGETGELRAKLTTLEAAIKETDERRAAAERNAKTATLLAALTDAGLRKGGRALASHVVGELITPDIDVTREDTLHELVSKVKESYGLLFEEEKPAQVKAGVVAGGKPVPQPDPDMNQLLRGQSTD